MNALVLLFVVLFPYPTKTVGTFIGTGAANTAVAFYAGFTGVISISMLLLNFCIVHNKQCMLDLEKSMPWFRTMMRGQVIGILCYAVITFVAFLFAKVALALTFAMWVFWALNSQDKEEDL